MYLSNFFSSVSDNCYIKSFATNTVFNYNNGNVQILRPLYNNLELKLPLNLKSRLIILYNDSDYIIKTYTDGQSNKIDLKSRYVYRLVSDGTNWTIVESEKMPIYTIENSNNLSVRHEIANTSQTNSANINFFNSNNEEFVFYAFSNGNDSNKGYIKLGKIENGNINFGNDFKFSNVDTDYINIKLLSNSRVSLIYKDNDNLKGKIITGTFNLNDLSFNFHDLNIYTKEFCGNDLENIKVEKINDYLITICFVNKLNNYGCLVTASSSLSCDTNCSSIIEFNNSETGDIGICNISSSNLLIAYYDKTREYAYIKLANILSNNATFYDEFSFNYGITKYIDVSKVSINNDELFLIGYQDNKLNSQGCLLLGEIVDTVKIKFSEFPEIFNTGNTEYININIIKSIENKLAITFKDSGNGGYGAIFTIHVDDINNILEYNDIFYFNENEINNAPFVNCDENNLRYFLIAHQQDALIKYGMVSIIS